MPLIGITGGLATGKSAVTALFKSYGAVVFSADEAVRAVQTPGSSVVHAIAALFGSHILRPDGSLDRVLLGSLVFTDSNLLKALNRIVHPPTTRLLRAQIDAVREDFAPNKTIVIEIPLLFEANFQDWFEQIIVVASSETSQVARLRARNGLNEQEARRRIAVQMPMAAKIACADVVIHNDGSFSDLSETTARIWQQFGCQPGTMR